MGSMTEESTECGACVETRGLPPLAEHRCHAGGRGGWVSGSSKADLGHPLVVHQKDWLITCTIVEQHTIRITTAQADFTSSLELLVSTITLDSVHEQLNLTAVTKKKTTSI